MIERKIKVQKESVVKEIPENLISDYLFMGWKEVVEKKIEEPRRSFKKD